MKCNSNPPLKPSVGFLDVYINKLKSLPMPQGSARCRPRPLPPHLACLAPSPHSPPSLASTLQAKLILLRGPEHWFLRGFCLSLKYPPKGPPSPQPHLPSQSHPITASWFDYPPELSTLWYFVIIIFMRTQIQKPKFIGSFWFFDFSWIGRDDWNQTVIPDRSNNWPGDHRLTWMLLKI